MTGGWVSASLEMEATLAGTSSTCTVQYITVQYYTVQYSHISGNLLYLVHLRQRGTGATPYTDIVYRSSYEGLIYKCRLQF